EVPSARTRGRLSWPRCVGGAVDVPDQSTRAGAPRLQPAPVGVTRSPLRRRPTGQAPPLPHHRHINGAGWLVASIVLVALSLAVFAGGCAASPSRSRSWTTRSSGGWPGW